MAETMATPVAYDLRVVRQFSTMALVWGGEVVRTFIGYGSSVGSSPISVQFLVWAVGTALLLLGAVGCWAAAVRVYRVRE